MQCPKCKRIIDDNSLKCSFCNTKLGTICSDCNTYNPITAAECSKCGKVLLKICSGCGGVSLSEAYFFRKCGLLFVFVVE